MDLVHISSFGNAVEQHSWQETCSETSSTKLRDIKLKFFINDCSLSGLLYVAVLDHDWHTKYPFAA